MTRARPNGMTLVEVLAVVVILGLLASILLMGFSSTFGRAKTELTKSGIGVIVGKVELYRLEKSAFPTNDVGLKALTDGMATPAASFYLPPDKLADPWGRPYLYIAPGPNGLPFEVLTLGADGQAGGEGEDLDVSSANLRDLKSGKTP
jgi:general secretion pathway protein G